MDSPFFFLLALASASHAHCYLRTLKLCDIVIDVAGYTMKILKLNISVILILVSSILQSVTVIKIYMLPW